MPYNTRLAAFDASEVVMTVGEIAITGLADGTFVEITQENNSFESVSGADGEVVRTKSNDRRHTITFTLLQSSQANALLGAQHNLDINSPNGDAILPMRVFDKASGTTAIAAKCWIEKPADVTYGKEQSDRVWVLKSNNVVLQHAGNPAV